MSPHRLTSGERNSARRVSRLRCFWDAGTGSQEHHPLGGLCCHLVAVAERAAGPGPISLSGGPQVQ